MGKVEMALMALFELIVPASETFLINFYRALTFEPDSEADFCRFFCRINENLEIRHRRQTCFLRMRFHCNDKHIDVFRFMATEAQKLRCHLCKKWVCSASWRSVPSSLKAPACARWCYKGVCRTVGGHLLKTAKGDLTPLGPIAGRTRNNLALQHQKPKLRPHVLKSLFLVSSPLR